MKDYSLSELRKINEAYLMVVEAQARPTIYKNLTPEQAETLAKLSPSYKSPQIWGNTSNWICAVANRLAKYQKMAFEDIYKAAAAASKDIADFEKFGKRLKKDIASLRTFQELSQFMNDAREGGMTMEGLSSALKNDGRARQCYSFMKNGGDDFEITYEDPRYLIGYPKNFKYNSKFSSIGKWCHTGSFGNGEYYWSDYGRYPVFYILNKQNGNVLCASYQGNGTGEVRDQRDNYPEGFRNNWNEFFTELGLKKPMVDDVNDVLSSYVEPDDLEPMSVFDRTDIDTDLVNCVLFADNDPELEASDYNDHDGNFYLHIDLIKMSPNYSGDGSMHTRYAADVDKSVSYTFDEFRQLLKEIDYLHDGKAPLTIERIIVDNDIFRHAWEFYEMDKYFSIDELIRIVNGEKIDFGFDSIRKLNDIRDIFKAAIREFDYNFQLENRRIFTNKYGDVTIYDNNISMSIDVDEAQALAQQIAQGSLQIHFEGTPDLLSANLDGKSSFSMKRIKFGENNSNYIFNMVGSLKRICKLPKDLPGQMHFYLPERGDSSRLTPMYFVGNNYDRDVSNEINRANGLNKDYDWQYDEPS